MTKPMTLIVKTTRAAMLDEKQKLIAKLEEKGNMVKWSDFAVESKSELFVFKTITLNADSPLNALKGYDFVKANDVVIELEATLKEIKSLINPTPQVETPPNPAPAAQNEPPEAKSDKDGEKVDQKTQNDSKGENPVERVPF